jgi:cytoskeletal protein RodZ
MEEEDFMSKNSEKDVQEMSFNGPGGRLRHLREAKGKTVEDVAKELRLNKPLITAIENDDYRDLHSDLLAKSYLRTYAKWAGYSETEILQEFDAKNLGDTIVSKKPQVIRDQDAAMPTHKTRWLTYAMIGGLVILSWLWWHNHGNSDKSIGSNVLPQETPPAATAKPIITTPQIPVNSNQPVVQPLPIQKITSEKRVSEATPVMQENGAAPERAEPEPPPSRNLDE